MYALNLRILKWKNSAKFIFEYEKNGIREATDCYMKCIYGIMHSNKENTQIPPILFSFLRKIIVANENLLKCMFT